MKGAPRAHPGLSASTLQRSSASDSAAGAGSASRGSVGEIYTYTASRGYPDPDPDLDSDPDLNQRELLYAGRKSERKSGSDFWELVIDFDPDDYSHCFVSDDWRRINQTNPPHSH